MDKLLDVSPNHDAAKIRQQTALRHILGIVSRAARVYQMIAFAAVSAFLLLVFANIALAVGKQMVDAYAAEAEFKLREHYLTELYPDFSKAQLREIDREMHGCRFEHAPYIQYAYHAFSGKWLHINRNGFRSSRDSGPWPPSPDNFNVFVFGGSTTFGYQVTDDQTIPAYLQKLLQNKCTKTVKVYNFGVQDYYSTLEEIQFSNFLQAGIKPDVAIFIDGTDDIEHHKDEPLFTSELTELMDERNADWIEAGRRYVAQLSMMQLVAMRAAPECISGKEAAGATRMYSENRRIAEAIANAYNVKTLFVWQPTPSYEYDLKYHPYPEHRRNWRDVGYGYSEMAETVKSHPQEYGKNFLWLADMQKQAKEPLYVDCDNYRPKFCEAIAREIAGKLLREKLIADYPVPLVVQTEER